MTAVDIQLTRLSVKAWRGPFQLASGQVRESGGRLSTQLRVEAPLAELQSCSVSLPPGLLHEGQPGYVWYANNVERGPDQLLRVVQELGPLSPHFLRTKCSSWWSVEERAAFFFRLALLCWYALQERDHACRRHLLRLLDLRMAPESPRQHRDFGTLFHNLGWMDEAERQDSMYWWEDKTGWAKVTGVLGRLLHVAWRSVTEFQSIEVSVHGGEVRASSAYRPEGLFSLLGLQLYFDIGRGRRIRRCGNPRCMRNEFFIALRATRMYCSRECQNAVMQSRYRERQVTGKRGRTTRSARAGKDARRSGRKKKRRSRRKSKS